MGGGLKFFGPKGRGRRSRKNFLGRGRFEILHGGGRSKELVQIGDGQINIKNPAKDLYATLS